MLHNVIRFGFNVNTVLDPIKLIFVALDPIKDIEDGLMENKVLDPTIFTEDALEPISEMVEGVI